MILNPLTDAEKKVIQFAILNFIKSRNPNLKENKQISADLEKYRA